MTGEKLFARRRNNRRNRQTQRENSRRGVADGPECPRGERLPPFQRLLVSLTFLATERTVARFGRRASLLSRKLTFRFSTTKHGRKGSIAAGNRRSERRLASTDIVPRALCPRFSLTTPREKRERERVLRDSKDLFVDFSLCQIILALFVSENCWR